MKHRDRTYPVEKQEVALAAGAVEVGNGGRGLLCLLVLALVITLLLALLVVLLCTALCAL